MARAFIKYIEYYLPDNIEENSDCRLAKKSGIKKRHICKDGMTASDLGVEAAKTLIEKYGIREEIDFLLLCTQSPDYFLPTTACILQDKLNLRTDIGALDFNLGCSGYIYGLGLAKGLVETNQAKGVLLITAETYSKYIHPQDGTVKPLFGDGASATYIKSTNDKTEGIHSIAYGTDGSGFENLIVPVGGMRNPFATSNDDAFVDHYGNVRTSKNLYMNGAAILEFSRKRVPDIVNDILSKSNLKKEDLDYCVFHQANKFILNLLRDECGLESRPFWNDLSNYGNTVSSSIPIALKDMCKNFEQKINNVLIVGFGVGLSWGGAIINLRHLNN